MISGGVCVSPEGFRGSDSAYRLGDGRWLQAFDIFPQ